MNSEMFETMEPTRLFFACAIPAIVTSVFGALYSVVDGMFVGRFLGADALAAVNLIMPIIMIVEAISNMIATGASVNMSILLGQSKREDASRIFSFSVRFILVFSCIIAASGYVLARPFVMLLAPGTSAAVIDLCTQYLRVYALFGPLIPIYFAMDNYLRVCGRQRASMIINIFTQVLNVVLDFILIVILHRGVTSAAIASCLSIVIGSVTMLFLFSGRRLDVFYTRGSIPLGQFIHIVVNGSSEFFSTIAASVMSVVMNLFLIAYGGTTAVAAFSVVMYVDSIIGMMNFGICDSLQPAISYCYGANLLPRMKEILRRILWATVIVSLAAFLFMFLLGPSTARIFVNPDDHELLSMSVTAIRIFSFSYLVGWIDMCFSSYFTALDRPGRSFVVSFVGTLVFPVLFLFLLTAFFGLNGVWMMATASALASGILTLILFATLQVSAPAL